MVFDFKKFEKGLHLPPTIPSIVTVPPMNFLTIRDQGDQNEKNGAYSNALALLYAVAYTLKMSYRSSYKIEGFFEYVVPPREGFWLQENVYGVNFGNKASLHWISVLRLPDFISPADVE